MLYTIRGNPHIYCSPHSSFLCASPPLSDFSKVSSTSPCCASSEATAMTSNTLPACGAVTGYSIFIASRMIRFCPSSTWSPGLINTSHTLAVKVAVTSVASLGASPALPSGFLSCKHHSHSQSRARTKLTGCSPHAIENILHRWSWAEGILLCTKPFQACAVLLESAVSWAI